MTGKRATSPTRWRFAADFDGVPRDERVIEVEVEPTKGLVLATGEQWEGVHVKARYALKRDRRWKRANLIGVDLHFPREYAERAAIRLLRGEAARV